MIVLPPHRIEDHQAFVLDELIPLIAAQARASGSPSNTVVLAAFLALATILQCEGMERSTLLLAIDTARMAELNAAKVLH